MILKILTVAGLATFEVYAAIPAGFAMHLSPWVIFFSSVVGGLVGAYVAAFFGTHIRAFFSKGKPTNEKRPKIGLIHRIWTKYGVIGLGLLGTMVAGAPLCIAVGVGFNAPVKPLLTWCCVGVITRCAILTTIGHFGIKLF